jgi:hypothetical protein
VCPASHRKGSDGKPLLPDAFSHLLVTTQGERTFKVSVAELLQPCFRPRRGQARLPAGTGGNGRLFLTAAPDRLSGTGTASQATSCRSNVENPSSTRAQWVANGGRSAELHRGLEDQALPRAKTWYLRQVKPRAALRRGIPSVATTCSLPEVFVKRVPLEGEMVPARSSRAEDLRKNSWPRVT